MLKRPFHTCQLPLIIISKVLLLSFRFNWRLVEAPEVSVSDTEEDMPRQSNANEKKLTLWVGGFFDTPFNENDIADFLGINDIQVQLLYDHFNKQRPYCLVNLYRENVLPSVLDRNGELFKGRPIRVTLMSSNGGEEEWPKNEAVTLENEENPLISPGPPAAPFSIPPPIETPALPTNEVTSLLLPLFLIPPLIRFMRFGLVEYMAIILTKKMFGNFLENRFQIVLNQFASCITQIRANNVLFVLSILKMPRLPMRR